MWHPLLSGIRAPGLRVFPMSNSIESSVATNRDESTGLFLSESWKSHQINHPHPGLAQWNNNHSESVTSGLAQWNNNHSESVIPGLAQWNNNHSESVNSVR